MSPANCSSSSVTYAGRIASTGSGSGSGSGCLMIEARAAFFTTSALTRILLRFGFSLPEFAWTLGNTARASSSCWACKRRAAAKACACSSNCCCSSLCCSAIINRCCCNAAMRGSIDWSCSAVGAWIWAACICEVISLELLGVFGWYSCST